MLTRQEWDELCPAEHSSDLLNAGEGGAVSGILGQRHDARAGARNRFSNIGCGG